jgi:hypothetical protein
MLSTKTVRPLALTTLIAILAMAGSAQGAEKKRKRYMQNVNDPYLAFVPGKPLLFAAERGRSVIYLGYPVLDVARKIEAPPDRRLDVIKASPDGTWIAGFFEQSSFRQGGSLRVWRLSTGETHLLLDDASRAFEFLDNNRLIVWQPKSGITQWELGEGEGKQTGPVITSATNVSVNVATNGMYLSPDHRYLLISGTCHGDDPKTDVGRYCLYDLHDGGSTVLWTEEDPQSMNNPNGGYFSRPVNELLVATNVDITGAGPPACTPVGQNRELCRDPGAVSLIENVVSTEVEKTAEPAPANAEAPKAEDPTEAPKPVPEPAPKAAPAGKRPANVKELFHAYKEAGQAVAETFKDLGHVIAAAGAARTSAGKNRRVLWTIRAGEEIGRFINSCVLSADGRWVAVASAGVTVSIFDTTQLQPKENALNGAWQEPMMVKQIEMP